MNSLDCHLLVRPQTGYYRRVVQIYLSFFSGLFLVYFFTVVISAPQVAVDGGHVLEYCHRVALQRVDTLSISGRVTVTAVGILPSLVKFSRWSGTVMLH